MIKIDNKTIKTLYKSDVDFKLKYPNLITGTTTEWQDVDVPNTAAIIVAPTSLASLGLNVGDTVTLTMDIRTSSGKKLRPRIEFWNSELSRTSIQGTIIENGEGRVSASGIVPDGYKSIRLLIDANSTQTTHPEHTIEQYKNMVFRKGTETYWAYADSELISAYTPNLLTSTKDWYGWGNITPNIENNITYYHPKYDWYCVQNCSCNTGKITFSALVRNTGDVTSKLRFCIHENLSIYIIVPANTNWIRMSSVGELSNNVYTLMYILLADRDQPETVDVSEIKLEHGNIKNAVWRPTKSEWIEPVGPFNLLKDSKLGYIPRGADSYSNNTLYSTVINSEGFLEYTLKSLVASGHKYRYCWVTDKMVEYYKEGETYTVSLDVRSTTTGTYSLTSYGVSNVNRKSTTINIPNTNGEWKRLNRTLILSGLENNISCAIEFILDNNSPIDSYISIRKVCLTKGTSHEYAPTYEEFRNSTKITKIYKDNKLVYNE